MRRALTGPWVRWLIALLVCLSAGRAVALPEQCTDVGADARRAAAQSTVDWFARTQREDGTFLYRFDAETGVDLGGYSWVRHAGVLLALEQARTAGIGGAGDVADRGWAVLERQVRRWGVRAGVVDGGRVSGGATALALAALGERRRSTGDVADDAELRAFAAQLRRHVRLDGTVADTAELVDGSPDATSVGRFTTGEVLFALVRTDALLPGEGWADDRSAIVRYLAYDKARQEGFVPDMADHWGAYALAEVTANGGALDELERAWAREQMGMTSVMIRYESQRTGRGFDRWLRGRTSVGSAVGTHGEAMQGWARVAQASMPELAAGARERLRCSAAVLVERQVSAAATASSPDPAATEGTWLWFGVTQMDDQQHALSALLGASAVLEDTTPLPRRSSVPDRAVLAYAAVFLAVDPVRAARRAAGRRRPLVHAAALLGVMALIGGVVRRLAEVSPPTLVLAGGAVMALAAVGGLVGRREPEGMPPLLAVVRPSAVVVIAALGGAGRPWLTATAVVVTLSVAVLIGRRAEGAAGEWAERLMHVFAVVVSVVVLVDAVYAL